MADFDKIGQYEILERIGVGSFTVAYRGIDPSNQREVAIKICIAQEEHLRTGFLRLAETAATLRHPNIVSVLEFGSGDSKPYLVEDYVPGEHLGWKIEAQEPISWGTRLDYLVQIAQGLRYAHDQGVLHRHVSPRCIRILEGQQAKISDFGIRQLASATARLVDPRGHAETEGYLAPEQALGLRADARTDIFYFGALAYELLTYESPFAGNNLTDFLRRVLDTTDDATIARLRRLPEGIARSLRRCLQRDPAARYENFSKVLDDLRPLLEKERAREGPSPATPPSPDDTQEIPHPVAPSHVVKDHLELAAEYMLGPIERPAPARAKPQPEAPELARLEETLPGIPASQTTAPPEPPKPPPPEAPKAALDETAAIPPPAPGRASPPVRQGEAASQEPQGEAPAPSQETPRPSPALGKSRPKPAEASGRRWILAAVLGTVFLVAMVIAAGFFGKDSGGQAAPTPPPPPAPVAAVPAPAQQGSLVIDAVPWGEISRIEGPDGMIVDVPPSSFTPLYLRLLPGSYEVEISHPDSEEPWTCQVRIAPGASAECRGEFELVEVLDYFKETGWWQ